MKISDERVAPSDLTPQDIELLEQISHEVFGSNRPALVGQGGEKLELPEPVFHLMVQIVGALREGVAISLVPEHEPMTTQAAANYLGVSRPSLVKLLETGEIPFHNVGTHRRVLMKDLKLYVDERDKRRRKGMNSLFGKIQGAGHYDAVDSGDES